MRKLIALLLSTGMLVGCSSTTEFGEASSAIQDSQEIQMGADTGEQELQPQPSAEVEGPEEFPEPTETTSESALEAEDQGQQLAEQEPSLTQTQDESDEEAAELSEEEREIPDFDSTLLSYVSDLNTCKLQQTNRIGYENKGFPYSTGHASRTTGKVNIALVAMDFDNAVGSGSVVQKFGDIPSKMEQWSRKWSRGNMNYDVQLHPEWVRAPKSAEWYNCPECHGEGTRKQSDAESLAQIIDAIDPYYDLSNIDFIGIIVPPKADKEYYFGIYGNRSASTDEGKQSFGIYGGLGITEEVSLWDLLIHEILHFQGFVGHGPGNGTEYGILSMQWGRSKAINIWEGFLAGWYEEDEVACVDARNIDDGLFVELGSIESFGSNYEGLVIKLNSEEALVVEHRKVFGSELLAYRLNVNAPTYRDDMGGRPADERNWWSYVLEGDGNIAIDDSITYEGVTVTKLGDGRFSISS